MSSRANWRDSWRGERGGQGQHVHGEGADGVSRLRISTLTSELCFLSSKQRKIERQVDGNPNRKAARKWDTPSDVAHHLFVKLRAFLEPRLEVGSGHAGGQAVLHLDTITPKGENDARHARIGNARRQN